MVTRGFKHYMDTFSHVAKWITIKIIKRLEIASLRHQNNIYKWWNYKRDLVQICFGRFVTISDENLVRKLNKTLYEFKQAWKCGLNTSTFLSIMKVWPNFQDGNLYYFKEQGHMFVLIIYVDDLFISNKHAQNVNWIKTQLSL